MTAKKASPAKTKGKSAASGRKRNQEGVTPFWGGGDEVKSAKGGGKKNGDNPLPPIKPAGQRKSANGGGDGNGRSPGRKRNPAPVSEDGEEVRKADELLLRAWESIYAKRDRFGKFHRE